MKNDILHGSILLFYAFDVGEDINFDLIRKKSLVTERIVPLSPYFKHYNIPLSFTMPEEETCISSKIYRFGVLSFCYKISFTDSFDGLKRLLFEILDKYSKQSDQAARSVFDKIVQAIEKPQFFHLKNLYFIVQVTPPKDDITPTQFRERYGNTIASLLRLETTTLSEYQRKEILASTTGYSGDDFTILDSKASFIYDTDYSEVLEFFESANIQQLQLQYFDRLLNENLDYFYSRPYTIPLKAYIPLLGGRLDTPISQLARLRVDISVITERLESSIHMAGDAYYSNFYSMLIDKLTIQEWKDSINKKLKIINDVYLVYQHRLEILHEEILTIVIIILIALEAILAFMK
jgi:hypothetical protein